MASRSLQERLARLDQIEDPAERRAIMQSVIEQYHNEAMATKNAAIQSSGMGVAGQAYGGPLNIAASHWPPPYPPAVGPAEIMAPWRSDAWSLKGRSYIPPFAINSIDCRRMALRVGIYNAQRKYDGSQY